MLLSLLAIADHAHLAVERLMLAFVVGVGILMLARLSSIFATGVSSAPNTVVRTHMLSVRRLPLRATTSRSVV